MSWHLPTTIVPNAIRCAKCHEMVPNAIRLCEMPLDVPNAIRCAKCQWRKEGRGGP